MFDDAYNTYMDRLMIKEALDWYEPHDPPRNVCEFRSVLSKIKPKEKEKEKELKVIFRSKPIRGITLELWSMR